MMGIPKRRTTVRFDVVSTVSRATVHNNDLPNILRGLRERVFAVEGREGLQLPPRPAAGVFEETLRTQRNDLLKVMSACQPITPEKFLEKYRGAKLARYQKAVSDNRVEPVPRKAAYLSTFIKGEFLNLDKKPDPAPRVIQPRHPRYNAALGRFIQPIEHRVYRAIAKLCGGPTVMKGYNADQTGQIMHSAWKEFNDPVGVSLDASRFDQHVSEEALRYEHSVYRALFATASKAERELLSELLEWQVDNIGVARLPEAVVWYKVRGNRMSGDMNTALGNCLLMCLMVRQYCQESSIAFRLMDNGDDATVFMERSNLDVFMEGVKPWFLKMGFTMKVEEPVDVLERVEFCQTHPVCIDGRYRMVRDPLVALSKDTLWKTPGLTGGLVDHTGACNWLHAVGECGGALCSGVPVMQEFYRYLANHKHSGNAQGFGDGESGFERMAQGMCRQPIAVSAEARYSFWLAFGLLPDLQESLERTINALEAQPRCRQRIVADHLNQVYLPQQFV